jgi:hypothetical protein
VTLRHGSAPFVRDVQRRKPQDVGYCSWLKYALSSAQLALPRVHRIVPLRRRSSRRSWELMRVCTSV